MNTSQPTPGDIKNALQERSFRPIAAIVIISVIRWAVAEPFDTESVAEMEADTTDHCVPEVLVTTQREQWKLCLNLIAPENDSCAEVTVSGHATGGAVIHFKYTEDGKWHYAGMRNVDTAEGAAPVQVDLTNDPEGALLRVAIHPAAGSDTSLLLSALRLRNDRPDTADTAPPSNLTVRRMVHNCHRPEYKVVIEERKWTYPPGYRYRHQVLNYPELSMFHYGGSVRMPTAKSLQKWADLYSGYHIANPDELKFDDPEEILQQEEWLNRYLRKNPVDRDRPKKRRRPPLITFRALK
ncbi:MAG: hypothetical protein JW913_17785 [Chitinispirillaceae bacterium]|nr:hypothetical protein [Chitinispirillaceae bacterium]